MLFCTKRISTIGSSFRLILTRKLRDPKRRRSCISVDSCLQPSPSSHRFSIPKHKTNPCFFYHLILGKLRSGMKLNLREITFGQTNHFWREIIKAISFQPGNTVDLGKKGEHATE